MKTNQKTNKWRDELINTSCCKHMLLRSWAHGSKNVKFTIEKLDKELRNKAGISINDLMEREAKGNNSLPYNVIAARNCDSLSQKNTQKNSNNCIIKQNPTSYVNEQIMSKKIEIEKENEDDFMKPKRYAKPQDIKHDIMLTNNKFDLLCQDDPNLVGGGSVEMGIEENLPTKLHEIFESADWSDCDEVHAILKRKSIEESELKLGKMIKARCAMEKEMKQILEKKLALEKEINDLENGKITLDEESRKESTDISGPKRKRMKSKKDQEETPSTDQNKQTNDVTQSINQNKQTDGGKNNEMQLANQNMQMQGEVLTEEIQSTNQNKQTVTVTEIDTQSLNQNKQTDTYNNEDESTLEKGQIVQQPHSTEVSHQICEEQLNPEVQGDFTYGNGRKNCVGHKVKLVKQVLMCAQCHEKNCPSLYGNINTLYAKTRKRNHGNFEAVEINENSKYQPAMKNLLETERWPEMELDGGKVNVQPIFSTGPAGGKKYTIVGIINNMKKSTIVSFQIDTGSYITAMSKRMAESIGLNVYTGQTRKARTASGHIDLTYEAKAKVDLGIVTVNMTIAITDSTAWPTDLILFGADSLESLKVIIDFSNSLLYINEIFPVKMFSDAINRKKYMAEIKSKYVCFKSVDIHSDKDLSIKPHSSKIIKITINKWDALSLQDSNVYFASRNGQDTEIHDMWLDDKFDWSKCKFRVTIANHSDKLRHIWKGDYLGVLKTIVPSAMKDKIDLPDDLGIMGLSEIEEDQSWDPWLLEQMESIFTVPERDDWPNNWRENIEQQNLDDNILNLLELNSDKKEQNATLGAEPSPYAGASESVKKVLEKAAKVIEDMERKDGRTYKPDFLAHNGVESEESTFNKLKLPEYLRRQWLVIEEEESRADGVTKLTPRRDASPEEIEAMIKKSVEYRKKFWQEKGRDEFEKMIVWGAEFEEKELKEFKDKIWSKRTAFGVDLNSIQGGIRYIGAQIRLNGSELPSIKNKGSDRFSKELFNRFIKIYLDANLAKRCMNQPHAKAFLIKKPKGPNIPRLETVQDLQNVNPTPEMLSKRWRFVIDESQINRCSKPYNYPSPTPRQILSIFQEGCYILSIDMTSFFPQVRTDKRTSEEVLTFTGPDFGTFASTVITQGHQASMSLCTQLLDLIFQDILQDKASIVWADNLIVCEKSLADVKETFLNIVDRAIEFNLILKPSEIQIGISTMSDKEPTIEILGIEFDKGRLKIPKRRQNQMANDPLPSTKKELDRLFGRMSFYSAFSTQFSAIYEKYRTLIKPQKGRKKFEISPDLRKTIMFALECFITNPGLHLLSEEDWRTLPLILFTDSSGTSYGGALMALKNDYLVPISATSRSWSKTNRRCCSNRREMLAVYYSCLDLHQLILNRKILVLTDNAFTRSCFQKPVEEIPMKLRTIVLTLRERYQFRCLYIMGVDNTIADLLSRFSLPSVPRESATFDDDDFKKLKFHMREVKVDGNTKEDILEQFKDFKERHTFNKEDEITKDIQESLPSCYTIVKDNPCSGYADDECCKNYGVCTMDNAKVTGVSDVIKKGLTTIHRVTDRVIKDMQVGLSEYQKERLKKADFVIITDKEKEDEWIEENGLDRNVWGKEGEERIQRLMQLKSKNMESVTHHVTGREAPVTSGDAPPDGRVEEAEPQCEKGVEIQMNETKACPSSTTKPEGVITRSNKRKRSDNDHSIKPDKSLKIDKSRPKHKYMERTHEILSVTREDDIGSGSDNDIGLNEIIINDDKSIEIVRDFSHDGIDNMSHILSKIKNIIPDEVREEGSKDGDDMCSDDPDDQKNYICKGDWIISEEWDDDENKIQSILKETLSSDDGCESDISSDEDSQVSSDENMGKMHGRIGVVNKKSKGAIKTSNDEKQVVKVSFEGKDIEREIKEAQNRDNDTQQLIELVKSRQVPLRHEIRTRSDFLVELSEIITELEVTTDGYLVKTATDENNDKVALLVVTDEISESLVQHFHITYSHASAWKIERLINKIAYVRNLKRLSRKVTFQCKKCVLCRRPGTTGKRHFKIFSTQRGKDINLDLVQMPKYEGFQYILIGVDLASGYILAKKLKTKNSKEVASKFENLILENSLSFSHSSSDLGKEFDNKYFRATLNKYNIKHDYLHSTQKNGNGSERAITRLLNLLRKTIDEEKQWPKTYKKVLFALNNTAMKYENHIHTPNMMFNARDIDAIEWPDDNITLSVIQRDSHIRNIMTSIADKRNLETSSLLANIASRTSDYKIGQTVLCWSEYVLSKRKTGAGALMKLTSFWTFGQVVNKINDTYVIKIDREDGTSIMRRYHGRQLRQVPDDLQPG